jgi:hypothetical protein
MLVDLNFAPVILFKRGCPRENNIRPKSNENQNEVLSLAQLEKQQDDINTQGLTENRPINQTLR